jgi:DhnA family fructose-bisphosphate aldolase class Ia
MSGKARRLKRLFRHQDGRAILTPIDHGLWYGPMKGIIDPVAVTRKVIGGSDGLLITPGFARAVMDELPADRALALRIGTSTALSPVQDYELVYAGIETALRVDADALVHTLYLGGSRDGQAIRDLGQIIESAGRYEMPVIAEFLPSGDEWGWEDVAHWARFGMELGADVIKTVYTGDPESFRSVVAGCSGGAGTAIGRRVWQAQDPEGLLNLFGKLIHGEICLEEALAAV